MKELLKKIWNKGLPHIFAGSFLTKCISFFGSIVLVRALSKSDYGVLSYLENIYGYIWIFAGLGLSNAILRFVVLKDEKEYKRRYFEYAVKTALLFNVLLILLAALLNTFYPHRAEYQNYSWLFYILLLSLPFQYVTDNVLGHERAMFDNRRYVAFSVTLTFGVIASKIVFGKVYGIYGAVFSQAAVYILLAVMFYVSTCRTHYGTVSFPHRGTLENEKEVNVYSIQYMITNGLWALFMLNDTFILGRFYGAEMIAEYRVAYTIPGSVALISSSIGIFVAPYFVRNEKNREWVRDRFKKTYLLSAVFVAVVCGIIALLAQPVVRILYGVQYLSVVPVMRILLLAAFFNCGLRYTTANILAAMGQVKYNMIISAIGMVLQIVINLIIVPRYASVGIAVTSCIVYLFMAVSLMIVFYRKYLGNKGM